MSIEIPFDILLQVLEHLDYLDLYNLSLVNRTFNETATKLLYRTVILSPTQSNTLNLRQKSQELNQLFISACLPSNCSYVLELRISGYLNTRSAPLNKFSTVLCHAIQQWSNVQTIVLTPQAYPQDLMENVLAALLNCAHLNHLTINSSCCDENCVPILTRLTALTSLTIENPTRVMLQALPEWLGRLQPTLTKLILKDNCGSVTPGVLKSFIPSLQKIETFGLGLSYSLTNDDVFKFLERLPALRSLDLRYYLQIRPTTVPIRLLSLRYFTVRYISVETRSERDHLCKWIRTVTRNSPLTTLTLINEYQWRRAAVLSFSTLVECLSRRHSNTLISVNLGSALVGEPALKCLFESCRNLETVELGTRPEIIRKLPSLVGSHSRVRSTTFRTPLTRPSKTNLDGDTIVQVMKTWPDHSLRHLSINGSSWEVSWKYRTEAGECEFVVNSKSMPGHRTAVV
ncbi:hypothetical protein C8Q75DRAFT_767528 [Abortiporus biennis]|nr:hypothetical protein C8Q75DRAFT_767528 [Abortiporus biennis]